jgi:hypothetical protein
MEPIELVLGNNVVFHFDKNDMKLVEKAWDTKTFERKKPQRFSTSNFPPESFSKKFSSNLMKITSL